MCEFSFLAKLTLNAASQTDFLISVIWDLNSNELNDLRNGAQTLPEPDSRGHHGDPRLWGTSGQSFLWKHFVGGEGFPLKTHGQRWKYAKKW